MYNGLPWSYMKLIFIIVSSIPPAHVLARPLLSGDGLFLESLFVSYIALSLKLSFKFSSQKASISFIIGSTFL